MAEEKPKPVREFTPEEIKTFRDNRVAAYKEQIEYLTPMRDYERLVTELAELAARKKLAEIQLMEMAAPEPQEEEITKEKGTMPNVPTNKISPEPKADLKSAVETERKLKKTNV